MKGKPKNRALDLGCSVGRASFELAREFGFVNGLDFSARFIRIAYQMQEKGVLRYELPEEGEIVSYHERKSCRSESYRNRRPGRVLSGRCPESKATI